jgi:hypothetical protein
MILSDRIAMAIIVFGLTLLSCYVWGVTHKSKKDADATKDKDTKDRM